MSFFSFFRKKKESAGFLQALPVAIWQRDAAGKIIYANDAYRTMAGSSEAELTLTLYTGKARTETVHLVINGERRLIECRETGSGGVAFDITAREELENQRKDLNQALTEVMENATSAMAFFTGTRQIARYNQAYLRLWGLEEAFLAQHPRCCRCFR